MAQPPCPYFGRCGGCQWQHLDYSLQLEKKQKSIQDLLHFQPIGIVSENPYSYRNRMDFVFYPKGIGLREERHWFAIVDVAQCSIANPRINELLQEVRTSFSSVDAYDVHAQMGTFRYAVIRATKCTDSITFILNEESSEKEPALEQIRLFVNTSSAKNILVGFVPPESGHSTAEETILLKGTEMLEEELCGKRFMFHGQGFFQNNTAMAEAMILHTRQLLQQYPTKSAHLLDLYGGVGTFGIVNADLFSSVTIVEDSEQSIEAAQLNIERLQVRNVRAMCLDSKKIATVNLQHPLYVITDPPRSGMEPKVLEQLQKLRPEVIIYISCNPLRLAVDMQKLKGYDIKNVTVFDLFPQTRHSEVVVLLERKASGWNES